MTLKRILLAGFTLAALYLGTGVVVRALASEETKIRWLVEDMREAYNAGRPGSCVAPLAEDWRHEDYAVDRQTLLGGLFQASRERDPQTRQLRSRVEIDEDSLGITVEGERARLAVAATFSRLRAGAWEEAWHLALEAELEHGEEGWKIVESRHRDIVGTHLGR